MVKETVISEIKSMAWVISTVLSTVTPPPQDPSSSGAQPTRNVELVTKSYAETMRENRLDPKCIIKIQVVNENEPDRAALMKLLKCDGICENRQIVDVKSIKNDILIIKAATRDDSNAIQKELQRKYRNSIKLQTSGKNVKIIHKFNSGA